MNEDTSLSTIVESSTIDLAISGWLAAHSRSACIHRPIRTPYSSFVLVCSEQVGLAHDTLLWVCLTVNTKQYEQALGLRVVQRLCDKYLGTHTHVTRHSFSHAMIQAGTTLPELQDRLGHESLATTGIYAKVFTGAKNPHADKFASLFGVE